MRSALLSGDTPSSVVCSVIVSTYNNLESLRKTLLCLERQSDSDFEILVADDGSGEATRHFLTEKASSGLRLTHLWQKNKGFRKARILNRAIRKATGNYLIFIDGDILVDSDFIATHKKLARRGFYITGGRHVNLHGEAQAVLAEDATLLKEQRVFHYGWLQSQRVIARDLWRFHPFFVRWAIAFDLLLQAPNLFKGCNSACWKEDALRIGGFDERFQGYGHEDRDFGNRLLASGVWGLRFQCALRHLHLDHARSYVSPAQDNSALKYSNKQAYCDFIRARLAACFKLPDTKALSILESQSK